MEMERQHILAEKLQAEYFMAKEAAAQNARDLLKEMPSCLIPNIDEWCRGDPLSDIYICGYSIPMVLSLWNSKDFLSALRVCCGLEKNYDDAVTKIWRMRR